MQTFINRTEQNNDHMRIIQKIQFGSSFKVITIRQNVALWEKL